MADKARLKVVADLRKYDHAFLSAQGVESFAKRFGLEGRIKPYRAKANPTELKGLTLNNGATEAVGMDAQILAMRICELLSVEYAEKFGRGSQLRSCCDALEQHYTYFSGN
jgi:hypothetical protein